MKLYATVSNGREGREARKGAEDMLVVKLVHKNIHFYVYFTQDVLHIRHKGEPILIYKYEVKT